MRERITARDVRCGNAKMGKGGDGTKGRPLLKSPNNSYYWGPDPQHMSLLGTFQIQTTADWEEMGMEPISS